MALTPTGRASAWMVSAGAVGYAASAVFSGLLHWDRALFVVPYALIVVSWRQVAICDQLRCAGSSSVLLSRLMPVILFYTTAVVMPDGAVVFYHDVYGHNFRLDQALRAGPMAA